MANKSGKKSGNTSSRPKGRVTPHIPRAGFKASGSRYGNGGKLNK